MSPNPKIRIEIVKHLAKQALDAMDGCGVENMTVAELSSACFSLLRNVMITILEQCDADEVEYNKSEFQNAIAQLYALVAPTKVN